MSIKEPSDWFDLTMEHPHWLSCLARVLFGTVRIRSHLILLIPTPLLLGLVLLPCTSVDDAPQSPFPSSQPAHWMLTMFAYPGSFPDVQVRLSGTSYTVQYVMLFSFPFIHYKYRYVDILS